MVARTFSKPQEARELEARARAKRLGVRVEVVSEARCYRTRSQSQPGEVYALVRTPRGWVCGCLGFYHGGVCKHLAQLERRAEREGWDFGQVCPLSQAARYFPLDQPDPEPPATPAAASPAIVPADARARGRAALADLYEVAL